MNPFRKMMDTQASRTEGVDDASPKTSAEENKVAGERGIASVNRARSLQSRVSNLLAMGLMSTLGLGLLTWYYIQTFSRQAQTKQNAQVASQSKAQGEMPLPSLGQIVAPEVRPAKNGSSVAEQMLGPPPEVPASRFVPLRSAGYSTTASYDDRMTGSIPQQVPQDRRLSGPVLSLPQRTGAVASERTAVATGVADVGGAFAGDPGSANGASGSAGSMATLLRPSVTPAAQARVLPTERMLLPKGAFIDCTLETAIDTSLPGLTTCVTATDTFSADGTIVLLERGTKLVGETRGEVRQGSARVFVLWTEARTPTGVVVPLASPGTDELGRSGLSGKVNRHFLERFGAAILISVIDGTIQAAVQSQNQGGSIIYNTSTSQDILTEVLKSTINIPPTVVKQNGDRIQILVARDLDFRSVYELRTTAVQ